MADNVDVRLGGQSPEEIAFQLFNMVCNAEEVSLGRDASKKADRKYLLDTFAECLYAVTNPYDRVSAIRNNTRRD